ncbi:MAG: DUF3426 domain-containing protein [Pseudomonadota bacterium]|nr:DUF3426 domain-containing protein [Pseudomonadota bacterium]
MASGEQNDSSDRPDLVATSSGSDNGDNATPGQNIEESDARVSPSEQEVPDISEEDLEQLQDPDPIDSGAGKKETFEDDNLDPEELPDPEPIPVSASAEEEPKKKGGILKKIFLILFLLIILGGAGAGLVLWRGPIVAFWPGANGLLYDMIGLRVPQPGDGLELSLRSPRRESKRGKDLIVFEIVVENTTDKPQRVPNVISSLADAEGNPVLEIVSTPPNLMLEGGKILRFKAMFPNAPASAKQSLAKWGKYPTSDEVESKKSEMGKKERTAPPPKEKDQTTPPGGNSEN